MNLTETIFRQGVPLGRLTFDANAGVAIFRAARDNLAHLNRRTWPDPVQAREDVLAAAEGAERVRGERGAA